MRAANTRSPGLVPGRRRGRVGASAMVYRCRSRRRVRAKLAVGEETRCACRRATRTASRAPSVPGSVACFAGRKIVQPQRHHARPCGRKDEPAAIRRQRQSKGVVGPPLPTSTRSGAHPRAAQRLRWAGGAGRLFAPVTNGGHGEDRQARTRPAAVERRVSGLCCRSRPHRRLLRMRNRLLALAVTLSSWRDCPAPLRRSRRPPRRPAGLT